MKLPFDLLTQTYTKPRAFLCETNKDRICELETMDMHASLKFNAYSELTFTVSRTYTNMITGDTDVNPFYEKIQALRLIFLEGFGYFEIQDPEIVSNGIREVKNVTAYSLEYTLSQKYIEELYINTGEVGSVEVIYSEQHGTPLVPVSLYNIGTPGLSLLDLALEKIYGWRIGHVDTSLRSMTRTFEISRASVYDFIVQDICEKFNCFAVFDTINNTINLYAEALITKHIGDGETTVFKVPSAYSNIGSVSIDGYKTTQYTYQIVETHNGVKTGYITFAEAPADSAKIEIIDGSQSDWVTDVYVSFENLAQEVNVSYSADDIKTVLTVRGADDLDIREVNMGLPYIVDISYYYTVDWMGQELFDAYTAYIKKSNVYQEEYAENAEDILGLQNDISFADNRTSLGYGVDSSVSSTTVGTYYIISGGSYPNYHYTEVSLPADYNANTIYYKLNGVNVTEEKVHTLYSAVRKYFIDMHQQIAPEIKDVATRDETWEELFDELVEQFEFVPTEFATLKAALTPNASADEASAAFKTFLDIIWTEMGRTPLKQLFLKPYEEIETINKEAGYSDPNSEYYWFYYPVTIMLASLNSAIQERQDLIDQLAHELEEKQNRNSTITDDLLIANNFTPSQLMRLSAFLREDEYTDDNFVETSIDTIETLMQTKNELLECGKIELSKLCEPKLAFSMDMANIYALPEFQPIIEQFQLGKLINVAIRDDYVKRARLLAADINFDDFSDFTCEFGELTNLRTPSSVHADLLASALSAGKTVASNASYWNKGADMATSTDLKIQQGLLSATGLHTSDQSIVIDDNGILLRKVNENGEFSPNQAWLKNNTILFSSDGFQTSRTGLGEFEIDGQTFYGPLAEAMFAGYIEGSKIVGGTINIGDGTFTVDEYGNVVMNAASIAGYVLDGNIISSINQSSEEVAINANKISLAGKNINLTGDNITISSTNFSVTKDGKITAKSGEIAGWTIYDHVLRKELTIDDVKYQMYMQAPDGDSTTNAFVVRRSTNNGETWDSQFAVNYLGKLTAKNANITGTITATSGSIAGYNIGSGGSYANAIYKRVTGTEADYEVGIKATSGQTDLAFYVKESTDDWDSNTNTFFIRNNGHLYAKNADITGKITASSGKIGGWDIGANDISGEKGNYKALISKSAIGTSGNVVFGVYNGTSWTCYMDGVGKLVASNADISGKITATSGSIGGCSISNGVLNVSAANITSGTFDTARIPNLSASKITSGTLDPVLIPNLSANKITSGTLDPLVLDSSVVTTGNFSSKTLSTGKLTIKSGCTLGSATYNATIDIRDKYVYLAAAGPTSYGTTIHEIVRQAVMNGSNRDIKSDIHDFDDRYDMFFDNLNPQLYKYNFELDEGYSMGYIWQETDEALVKSNLTKNDVGAIYESGAVTGGLGLRKTDFIALNTWQIQRLKSRVEELENKLEAIERNDTK